MMLLYFSLAVIRMDLYRAISRCSLTSRPKFQREPAFAGSFGRGSAKSEMQNRLISGLPMWQALELALLRPPPRSRIDGGTYR